MTRPRHLDKIIYSQFYDHCGSARTMPNLELNDLRFIVNYTEAVRQSEDDICRQNTDRYLIYVSHVEINRDFNDCL